MTAGAAAQPALQLLDAGIRAPAAQKGRRHVGAAVAAFEAGHLQAVPTTQKQTTDTRQEDGCRWIKVVAGEGLEPPTRGL